MGENRRQARPFWGYRGGLSDEVYIGFSVWDNWRWGVFRTIYEPQNMGLGGDVDSDEATAGFHQNDIKCLLAVLYHH